MPSRSAQSRQATSTRGDYILIRLAVVATLTGFALAQPLYDLLGRNPEFFIARRAGPLEITTLVVTLSVLIPVLLTLVSVSSHWLNRLPQQFAERVIFGTLLSLTALPAFSKLFPNTAWLAFTLAVAVGGGGRIIYERHAIVRQYVLWLSPSALIFPGMFLLATPVTDLLVVPTEQSVSRKENVEQAAGGRPPIVMVILDELPLNSLLDINNRIDPKRYPNFARLADDVHWFRSATTVSTNTMTALPAILTGNYPKTGRFPTVRDYPDNIFTLLAPHYRMNVTEAVTQLCPVRLCPSAVTDPPLTRLVDLFRDTSIVYMHILAPPAWHAGLPNISNRWGDFQWDGEDDGEMARFHERIAIQNEGDRALQFEKFVDSIASTGQPALNFLHIMLPHAPYNYLPSGTVYTYKTGLEADVDLAYRRHLLQVGFVDTLLGKLLDRLQEIGLYDQTMLIVTADHGISFHTDKPRRALTRGNYEDLISVPLLIKQPHQTSGLANDRNVETIDIAPTVLEAALAEPPSMDGDSVFQKLDTERPGKTVYFAKASLHMNIDPAVFEEKRRASLEHRMATDSRRVSGGVGKDDNPVGRKLESVNIVEGSWFTYHLHNHRMFQTIDPESGYIPAYVSGRLNWRASEKPRPHDAVIAVNGQIWAEAELKPDGGAFSTIVPEEAFTAGANEVELLLVDEDPAGGSRLLRTSDAIGVDPPSYRLYDDDEGREYIVTQTGKSIPVKEGAVKGWLDRVRTYEQAIEMSGWAADVGRHKPAERVVIFRDGKSLRSIRPDIQRDDVAHAYKDPPIGTSGFSIQLSESELNAGFGTDVRVFAISDASVASELGYPEHYPW